MVFALLCFSLYVMLQQEKWEKCEGDGDTEGLLIEAEKEERGKNCNISVSSATTHLKKDEREKKQSGVFTQIHFLLLLLVLCILPKCTLGKLMYVLVHPVSFFYSHDKNTGLVFNFILHVMIS